MYKYDWVWEKERPSNPILANKQVLKYHEMICIFYKKQSNFFPQMRKREEKNKRNNKPRKFVSGVNNEVPNSNGMNETGMNDFIKPKSVLKINMERGLHPTQKPVALMEYLLKTYTKENDLILDNCMGSGTTNLACIKLNRKSIGIEKEKQYYDVAVRRASEYLIIDSYKNIQTKENYDKLLSSGMFWEFHPELSGNWDADRSVVQYCH